MKKVIVITGASSGMGSHTAIHLAKEGHIVYGLARRVERMKEFEDAGGHPLKLDITAFENIQPAIDQIIREHKRIDVLWNNAGYNVMGAIEDVSLEDAKRQMDVNLFGLAEVTKAVLPHMRKQNSGLIINTSSVGGKIFSPLNAWYHASKHALEGWSDCLRMEVKHFGINVVILEPGSVKSEFGNVLMEPFIERSKNSAYTHLTAPLTQGLKQQYSPNNTSASSPDVVSNLIIKILESPRPKNRYPVGNMAYTTLWMRKLLGDRLYEKIVMSAVTR